MQFSAHYLGSGSSGCGVSTYVDQFAGPDVLAFAVRYEGNEGCMRHMDAARCGHVVVMSRTSGRVIRRIPRAEALAAECIARAFGAWFEALAALEPTEDKPMTYTIVIYPAAPELTNEWNDFRGLGWPSMVRGSFATESAAHARAAEILPAGAPYDVKSIDE